MNIFNLKQVFILISFSIIQIAHGQSQPEYQHLDSNLLQSVFDTSEILRKVVFIEKKEIKKKRIVRIMLNNGFDFIEGRLLGFNKFGLFFYESSSSIMSTNESKIGFYPYKKIKKVRIGRAYNFFLGVTTICTYGITTLFAIPSWDEEAPIIGLAAAGVYGSYGQIFVAPIYAIRKEILRLNWKLNTKNKSNEKFYQFLKTHPGEINFASEFVPRVINNAEISPKNKNYNDTNTAIKNADSNIFTQNNQGNQLTESNSATTIATTPKAFLEGLAFGDDNNVKAKWIYQEFNASKVKEAELQSVFKNIRSMQLSRGQLTKYNTSQLQFLAMMICSGGGYNMKSAANLTEKQKSFIKTYESGYLEEVNINGTISTMNLSDYDLENIKVIFEELKSR